MTGSTALFWVLPPLIVIALAAFLVLTYVGARKDRAVDEKRDEFQPTPGDPTGRTDRP